MTSIDLEAHFYTKTVFDYLPMQFTDLTTTYSV